MDPLTKVVYDGLSPFGLYYLDIVAEDIAESIHDKFVVHQRYTPEIEEEDGSQRQADT